jgi:2-polyprenyl-6-methoxyphenol hydroxylase-like FAD-dependent oxidoreductase
MVTETRLHCFLIICFTHDSQDPLDAWVKGKLILIGDAAHAMLPTQGQGASQSFEDAVSSDSTSPN